jgi:TonB family protein
VKPKVFRAKAVIAALAMIAVLCSTSGASAQETPQERELIIRREMELAKRDFRDQRYDSAEEHLKRVLALDGNLSEARLGLAVTYSFQFIPGSPSPENMVTWQNAVNAFQDLLAKDPKNAIALKSLGALHFMTQKYSEARDFYLRAASANPNDADAYYSVGVIDWSAAYKDTVMRKSQAGLDTNAEFSDSPRDQKNCMDLKAANETRINDGLKNLSLAMEKRQDFSDAMSYMSLLYQRKADIECGNPAARAEDYKLSRRFAGDAVAVRNRGQQQAAQLSGSAPTNAQNSDDVDFSKLAESLLFPIPPPPQPPPPPPPPAPVRHGSGQSGAAGDQGQGRGSANRVRITPAEMQKNSIVRLKPEYPRVAAASHIEGDVTLHVVVGKDGRPKTVTAVAGPPILQQAAIDAVKQWTFRPVLVDGEPMEAESNLIIHFPPE